MPPNVDEKVFGNTRRFVVLMIKPVLRTVVSNRSKIMFQRVSPGSFEHRCRRMLKIRVGILRALAFICFYGPAGVAHMSLYGILNDVPAGVVRRL